MPININNNYGPITQIEHFHGVITNGRLHEEPCASPTTKEAEEVPFEEVNIAPEKPNGDAPLNTSFFRISEYHTYNDCMQKLLSILSSSNKKTAICRQLFDEEGRKWFNLYDYSAEKITALITQFPCGVKISADDIRKAKAEVAVEVTKARTAKDRLSKYDL